jgi:hypothetical protein
MKYFNYMICIPFVIIILYSLFVNWLSTKEGYGSYDNYYSDVNDIYTYNDDEEGTSTTTTRVYYSIGDTVTSTEHPGKTGTITSVPTNSYDDIGIKYSNEPVVYVARSSITIVTSSTGSTVNRPSWLSSSAIESTTGATSYTYTTLDGTKYTDYNTSISSEDDIPTPGSGFADEKYIYGNITYEPTASAGGTAYTYSTLETDLKPTTKAADYDDSTYTSYSGSTAGTSAYDSLRGTTGSTYSLNTTILIPENDILGDYTSPSMQTYVAQDSMGYTTDSSTLNKILQMLSSMATDNHCKSSAFGCCSDKVTARTDLAGTNCSAALNEEIKTYIDSKLAEKSYSFTETKSDLLQTKLPPTIPNNLSTQKSYTNTIFLSGPRGGAASSCPEPAFDSKTTPTYSDIKSGYLPTPLVADFSSFGR